MKLTGALFADAPSKVSGTALTGLDNIPSSGGQVPAVNGGVPTGAMFSYGALTAPSGYLLCDGSAVSRTTYAALFAVISTTYGIGDGSTTFNVPDKRGRISAGLDNMGGSSANRITDPSADTLGGNFGDETHQLTELEMPAHTHDTNARDNGIADAGAGNAITSSINSGTISTDSTGGNDPHNNVQPTQFDSWIIKT